MEKKPPGAPCPQRFRDAVADEYIYLVNKRYHKGIIKIQNKQLDLEMQDTTHRLPDNSPHAQWTPSSEMSDHASETSDDSASGSKDDHGHLTISDPIKSASNSIEITAYCEENPSTAGAPSSVKESDFLKTDKQIQDEGLSFWAN